MGFEFGFLQTACLTVLVLLSAFLSSSEVALFSLSRFQLRALKDFNRAHHRRLKKLLGDPAGLLVSILLTNEIINVSISTLITSGISRAANHSQAWFGLPPWAMDTLLGLSVTTPVILILCEATPKVLGTKANELLAPLSSRPLTLLYTVLQPARVALKVMVNLTLAAFTALASAFGSTKTAATAASDVDASPEILREEDFLLMVEEGQKEGALHATEVELIKNVLEFDDSSVSEIATPLNQIATLNEHTTIKTALAHLRSHSYARIPIVGGPNKRAVVGVLYAKDLIRAKLQPEIYAATVTSVMRRPLFVSPTLRLHSLFRKMRQQRTHIAVLGADSHSEATGIVTMNDVLEALLEDVLPDELDHDDDQEPSRA